MKPINMDKQEWRKHNFKRNDSWRSEVVYQCQICHVKSNKWFMGGWPGMGPRIICPGDSYSEHDDIEKTMQEVDNLEDKLKRTKKYNDAEEDDIKIYIENLKSKIKFNEKMVEKIREKFKGLDDVEGKVDGIENYYPSARVAGEKNSFNKI